MKTTYTVAFLKKGYIQEMNEEEFKKIEKKLGKYIKLLNVTSFGFYLK
jgi:hypothetical protein